ncbi:hypothetical protein T4E_8397 [Trichinella pseudospiralis]|uniref:Retrovirus-related Pol polyprotein from transposon TNT 1-94 n=1 Tax=Trichinella pseudospiralis TaxID=6337 RepID=A0A0V0XR20_TRIPS|nr:hypothetical protein T4E_8397 [Trichinella pseudospiralis]
MYGMSTTRTRKRKVLSLEWALSLASKREITLPNKQNVYYAETKIENAGYKRYFEKLKLSEGFTIDYPKDPPKLCVWIIGVPKLYFISHYWKPDSCQPRLKRKLQMDTALSVHTHACLHTWHRRMGHRDMEAIRKLNKEQLVKYANATLKMIVRSA